MAAVGALTSLALVLIGYFLLRQYRPNVHRPVRLPSFFKWVALALAAFLIAVWAYGGISYSIIGNTEIYYFLGWAVAAAYLPLYLWRTRVEDKRVAAQEAEAVAAEPMVPQ